ncbi:MAG: hypothetical protein BWX80_03954 [Candidatus Hydrogenedentes bacterium ADurb.Bin101]|nr:MAG: hypothetical protein BWX80_03954 [Candidatus Hydrogenedentes bacterium ADurb.Bin101]
MEYDEHGFIKVLPLFYIAFAEPEAGTAFDLLV